MLILSALAESYRVPLFINGMFPLLKSLEEGEREDNPDVHKFTRNLRQGTSVVSVLPCLDSACLLYIRRHEVEAMHPLVIAASGDEHCKSSKTWDECTRGERK